METGFASPHWKDKIVFFLFEPGDNIEYMIYSGSSMSSIFVIFIWKPVRPLTPKCIQLAMTLRKIYICRKIKDEQFLFFKFEFWLSKDEIWSKIGVRECNDGSLSKLFKVLTAKVFRNTE